MAWYVFIPKPINYCAMEIGHTRKRGSMMDNLQLDKLKTPTFYEATGFLDDDYTGIYLRGSIGNDYY